MAEIKDKYKNILDDEDYAEIVSAAAEIPVSEKQAATHKSEDYGRGEIYVRTASLVMIFVSAAELAISAAGGKLLFSVVSGICVISSVISAKYMARGKAFAKYIAVGTNIVGIIICVFKMIGFAGSGRGTAFVLVICLIMGSAEIIVMILLISDKRINAFFTYNQRLDRLREINRRHKFLESIGKRFK